MEPQSPGSPTKVNREIYDRCYTPQHLRLKPTVPYDRRMIELRFGLLARYGEGRDVLDLCCGTGSYLVPMLHRFRRAVGVDFSSRMLEGLRSALNGRPLGNLTLVMADATALPLASDGFDFVYSFSSLYYVPLVERAISEIGRVLRPGGFAAIELGNRLSLNTLVSLVQHEDERAARPFHVGYRRMLTAMRGAGLHIREHRAFQLLPMHGVPERLRFLYPVLTPRWKSVLGIKLGPRMLDEWVSGAWPLRHLAFRQLLVAERAGS